ncbi:TerD family protein [Nocardia sp. alder85J]|uniref:TerD family protein n=1 Tax=Nocardia sp. alder85J TaxID=2862949 RepID=UPI001CD2B5B3|nr:TerD family protein [Nocardia sp. alder85J]MCX4091020.1 TerD family protein [Nocardia sp. alder85J]
MSTDVERLIIERTLCVPIPDGPAGDGSAVARQFDAALMSVGFKLSPELFAGLCALSAGAVLDLAVRVLDTVRRLVGDHVQHNVYFRDFPRNVPDTMEFWTECLLEALADPEAAARVHGETALLGTLNLLSLPRYGRYLHSYDEMLAAHAEFVHGAGDRVTVLARGGDPVVAARELYLRMAGATTPGNDDDRAALRVLAARCASDEVQPQDIPVRENRALINAVRLAAGAPVLANTVTDVLRLACALSDGDVTLAQPTRFRPFGRATRRGLLAALDGVIAANRDALADVNRYREQWKRLGERLHPHEFPQWPHAGEVFAVARGDERVRSTASRVEELLGAGEPDAAAALLQRSAPGMLYRSADRLLRATATATGQQAIANRLADSASRVSGRVLLSLREHLADRSAGGRRVFVNRHARGHIADDTRPPIADEVVATLTAALDGHLRERLTGPRWVVDPAILDVALPISGKSVASGFGTLPRGSRSRVDGELLRFFVHWRQARQRTDFDLSALLLDSDFRNPAQLSFTNLGTLGGRHSGDITSAPEGASEFIDLTLPLIPSSVVVPQVNIYDGEGFEQVAESFFGYMIRDASEEGAPYEPRTVRMKSELRGQGRVALPLVFVRDADGWEAVWLHLYLTGDPGFNQVENNRATTTDLVRSILARRYLTVGYLAELVDARIGEPDTVGEPVTYIGLERPEKLPEGSVVVTPANLGGLIPG